MRLLQMVDMSFFVVILFVFIIAYGVSLQAILYPNSELNIALLGNIFKKAYFQIYGELFLEELEGYNFKTNIYIILCIYTFYNVHISKLSFLTIVYYIRSSYLQGKSIYMKRTYNLYINDDMYHLFNHIDESRTYVYQYI